MIEYISESGMDFVADNTFYIEKSKLYMDTGRGIRSVEFIRIKGNRMLFVEAKTSFPNPNHSDDESAGRCREAIQEICDKFKHSLNLYTSVLVRTKDTTFPEDFVLPRKVTLEFVLVIKNHESDWCRDIEAMLRKNLPRYLMKIWRPYIRVINHADAISRGLAS